MRHPPRRISRRRGIKSLPGQAHYTAAKHGVVGLSKSAAIELGEYGIRVNTIHPWGVATPMADDPYTATMLTKYPNYAVSFGSVLPPYAMAEPNDISDAVIWLASGLGTHGHGHPTHRRYGRDQGVTPLQAAAHGR
jgi:NAD(P)-dependent dehydrogenase (short-subunit alcohol dehydrogenase family)